MKLARAISLRLFLAVVIVAALWGVALYFGVMALVDQGIVGFSDDIVVFNGFALQSETIFGTIDIDLPVITIGNGDLWWMTLCSVVLLLALTVLLIVKLAAIGVRRCVDQLHRLIEWTDNYRPDIANTSADMHLKISEFRRLNDNFRQIADRMSHSYSRQKTLIDNVARETETPVKVWRSRLSSLLASGHLSNEMERELRGALNAADRLQRVTGSLLLLSRIDNGEFADAIEINLAALAGQLAHDYENKYAFKRLDVSVDIASTLNVMMHPQLAHELIDILLSNAFEHTAKEGRVEVVASANHLMVKNASDGNALDGNKIFQMFCHDPANTSSIGLGLPVARAISEMYDMKVLYRFVDPMHVFILGG